MRAPDATLDVLGVFLGTKKQDVAAQPNTVEFSRGRCGAIWSAIQRDAIRPIDKRPVESCGWAIQTLAVNTARIGRTGVERVFTSGLRTSQAQAHSARVY